jgi:hypothetical protein
MHLKVKSVDDLARLSREDLEREANVILYGEPNMLEEAMERQIFRRLYIPRNLNRPLVYVAPKVIELESAGSTNPQALRKMPHLCTMVGPAGLEPATRPL